MLVIYKITKEQFNAVVEQYTTENSGDYYTAGEGKYRKHRKMSDETLGRFMRSPVRQFLEVSNEDFELATIASGYTINEHGAIYSTCNGNVNGVYQDTFGSYVFYHGARSRFSDMPFYDVLNLDSPFKYVTSLKNENILPSQSFSDYAKTLDVEHVERLLKTDKIGMEADREIRYHFNLN